jgi:hypothetical protein
MAQKAFTWRLRALPYHYTAFYDAHTFGCSVMRPLFFSFPTDNVTYPVSLQWMLGDAIMIAPILYEGINATTAYFPAGVWYDLYNHTAIDTSSGGQQLTVKVCGISESSKRCSLILHIQAFWDKYNSACFFKLTRFLINISWAWIIIRMICCL